MIIPESSRSSLDSSSIILPRPSSEMICLERRSIHSPLVSPALIVIVLKIPTSCVVVTLSRSLKRLDKAFHSSAAVAGGTDCELRRQINSAVGFSSQARTPAWRHDSWNCTCPKCQWPRCASVSKLELHW